MSAQPLDLRYDELAGRLSPKQVDEFGQDVLALGLDVTVNVVERFEERTVGPVLAFLVATPATSITALLVCYALLGIKFTVFIFFAVIVMGLVMGLIGNLIRVPMVPVAVRPKAPPSMARRCML